MDTQTSILIQRIHDLEEKVGKYESLLHTISLHMIAMDHDKIKKLLSNIDDWSYAHRRGNGEHSDEEQAAIVRRSFERLTDV